MIAGCAFSVSLSSSSGPSRISRNRFWPSASIDLFEHIARGAARLGERGAHADRLAALPRKKECAHLCPCYEPRAATRPRAAIAKAGEGRMSDEHRATAELLGPWMSIAMVIGYMIGSAHLPAARDARALWRERAHRLGRDNRRHDVPRACAVARSPRATRGGPQSYVQQAFGPTAAYFIMWMYWVSVFTSTAGIAVAFGGARLRPLAASRARLGGAARDLRDLRRRRDQSARRSFGRRVPGGHDADQAASADRRDRWSSHFASEAAARPNRSRRSRSAPRRSPRRAR